MSLGDLYVRNLVSLAKFDQSRYFYRLHPVSKIVLASSAIAVAMVAEARGVLIAFVIVVALSVIAIGVKRLASLAFSVILVFTPMILFALFYATTSQGLSSSAAVSVLASISIALARVFVMALAFSIAILTSRPQSIARMFNRVGVPYVYVYGFIMALRFVFVVLSDMHEILLIQRARGLNTSRGFLGRLRSYVSVFIPLIISTLSRADEIDLSLELKGFGYSSKRTYTHVEGFGFGDVAVVTIAVALLSIPFVFG